MKGQIIDKMTSQMENIIPAGAAGAGHVCLANTARKKNEPSQIWIQALLRQVHLRFWLDAWFVYCHATRTARRTASSRSSRIRSRTICRPTRICPWSWCTRQPVSLCNPTMRTQRKTVTVITLASRCAKLPITHDWRPEWPLCCWAASNWCCWPCTPGARLRAACPHSGTTNGWPSCRRSADRMSHRSPCCPGTTSRSAAACLRSPHWVRCCRQMAISFWVCSL